MELMVQNSLVRCLIPTLNVQKLDQDLVLRKRQDTLEMCRMFTNKTGNRKDIRHQKQNAKTNRRVYLTHDKYKRRVKRSVEPETLGINPSLKVEDLKKVEDLVDKLYDDSPVTYRKLDVDSLTTEPSANLAIQAIKNVENASDPKLLKSGRRHLQFRPALLLGPLPSGAPRTDIDAQSYIPWPKLWANGIIPYFIDPKTYDSHLAEVIMTAFEYMEKATCIRLQKLREKPRDSQSMQHVEWVYITNPSGIKQCVHSNEETLNFGVQMVVLGYDCMSTGEILHEIMHVLGFSHEHTRPDRDQHLTVMWDNIKPGYKKYFELRKEDILMRLNLPYDHASVLHYPARAFSKNGQMTLVAEQGIKLGQREALSETDVAKVSLIYGAECVNRNKEYLLATCPSVVKSRTNPEVKATEEEIQDYFRNRLWEFGIVNFKLRDPMEFSAEERDNIKAVINHIEKETCIEFRDLTEGNADYSDKNIEGSENDVADHQPPPGTGPVENVKLVGKLSYENNKQNSTAPSDHHSEASHEASITHKSEESSNTISDGKSESENEIVNVEITSDNEKIVINTANEKEGKGVGRSAVDKLNDKAQKMPNRVKRQVSQSPRTPLSPHRRHVTSMMTLTRSLRSGCTCPPPGKVYGDAVLEISTDCFNSVNDLLHVFVHILGLDHQHNMHDRDNYLRIFWNNMTEEVKAEFEHKLPPAAAVGFPYDYLSVTHFPWLGIKNGDVNMMYPIWNDGWAMGHWQGLSSTDVQKINSLYYDQCLQRKQHVNGNNDEKVETFEDNAGQNS